jgi:hypothetical protein
VRRCATRSGECAVKQITINLLSNAVKFALDGGRATSAQSSICLNGYGGSSNNGFLTRAANVTDH